MRERGVHVHRFNVRVDASAIAVAEGLRECIGCNIDNYYFCRRYLLRRGLYAVVFFRKGVATCGRL